MLRKKLLVALLALGLPCTPAFAQSNSSFRYDGNTYNYSIVSEGSTIRLAGFVVEERENFYLRVHKNGSVEGAFGDRPVSFRVSKRSWGRLAAKLVEANRLARGVEVSTR